MRDNTPGLVFRDILKRGMPKAKALIKGNAENPNLTGTVKFYETPYGGVLIEAEIYGLPNMKTPNSSDFYGFHIHEKGDCTLPFDKTGDHYSSTPQEHPKHSGDLLPLMGNQGYAWMSFYDNRITIPEIMGRSVVIHDMPDDFKTQPSGASGGKIGCGVIKG